MIAEKTEAVERMMSAALAQTEELIELLMRGQTAGDPAVSKSLDDEVESRRRQAQALRELLESRTSRSLGS